MSWFDELPEFRIEGQGTGKDMSIKIRLPDTEEWMDISSWCHSIRFSSSVDSLNNVVLELYPKKVFLDAAAAAQVVSRLAEEGVLDLDLEEYPEMGEQ